MAKEDLLLRVEMGKLEIQPAKINKIVKEENPFTYNLKHKTFSRTLVQHQKCSCSLRRINNNKAISKKKSSNKILKDPVLKILQTDSRISPTKKENNQPTSTKFHSVAANKLNTDILNLCALVDNCNQLRISSDKKEKNITDNNACSKTKWWKNDISRVKHFTSSIVEKTQAGTCSQQALNPPCDVTIDELASYFETLVHIPKKMSSMAEMMYI